MSLQRVANFIGNELHQAHRGVIYLARGDFLAFGNDGYDTDERAKREVEAVRSSIAGQATEVGFASSGDGYTWAMLLRTAKACATNAGREAFRTFLTMAMWKSWLGDNPHPVDAPFMAIQGAIAEEAIATAWPRVLELLAAA
jgi:hypothetical protein